MTKIAAPSVFDVAYWFLRSADNKNFFIEDEKLHHLLFLSQIIYLQNHGNEILFPSMFLVTEKGFIEPNILKIFANGHPYMPHIKIDDKTAAFLEKIWNKYATLPLIELRSLITQSQAFLSSYDKNQVVALDMAKIAHLFTPEKDNFSNNRIRMSQRGPVVVSQWQPKKVKKQD